MLKTALAAALVIGAASAAHAQTYTFSGLKGATLTLSGSGGLYSGSFTPKGGTAFDALAYSNSYAGKGTIIASSIDTSVGSDYDVVFVIDGTSKNYTEYAEQLTTKKFKKIGSGTYKSKK
jgi:hypothetical protein